MGNLLQTDPELGQSRLEWLRKWPQAKSVAGPDCILNRLEFVRAHSLPSESGEDIHPARLSRFAREGRVAAVDRICTPMPGEPVLAARLQPPDRVGALQFQHRPCVRRGGALRPRLGEDGAPLRSGRRGDDDDGAGPHPVGRTAGYDAPPCQVALTERRLRPEPDSMGTVPDPTRDAAACLGFRPWPSNVQESTIPGATWLDAYRNPAEKGWPRHLMVTVPVSGQLAPHTKNAAAQLHLTFGCGWHLISLTIIQ